MDSPRLDVRGLGELFQSGRFSARVGAGRPCLSRGYCWYAQRQLRRPIGGGKVMEWFSQKTSIFGIQIANWAVVLGAIIIIMFAYSVIK